MKEKQLEIVKRNIQYLDKSSAPASTRGWRAGTRGGSLSTQGMGLLTPRGCMRAEVR